MSNANQPSIRQLIAYKHSRDRDSLRRFVAHNALYRKMRAETHKSSRPPKSNLYVPSRTRPVREAGKFDVLDVLIDKLILNDLKEQERLVCGASE